MTWYPAKDSNPDRLTQNQQSYQLDEPGVEISRHVCLVGICRHSAVVRDATMAVSAPYLAFSDLSQDGFSAPRPLKHVSDIVQLVAHMVKLKYHRVRFSAISARMIQEIAVNENPIELPARVITLLM